MEFEWDAVKELVNIQKHGVPFADAVETFFDSLGFQMVDRKHSLRDACSLLALRGVEM